MKTPKLYIDESKILTKPVHFVPRLQMPRSASKLCGGSTSANKQALTPHINIYMMTIFQAGNPIQSRSCKSDTLLYMSTLPPSS